MEFSFCVLEFQSRWPRYHRPSEDLYRLYRSGRVIRSGRPIAFDVMAGVTRSEMRTAVSALPVSRGPEDEHCPPWLDPTDTITWGSQCSVVSTTMSHAESFTCGAERVLANAGTPVAIGARTRLPAMESQMTAVATVDRN